MTGALKKTTSDGQKRGGGAEAVVGSVLAPQSQRLDTEQDTRLYVIGGSLA